MITVSGKVIKGENIGEKLGYPTANFSKRVIGNKKISPGVYIAKAILGKKEFIALFILGVPGFRRFKLGKVETYLIGRRNGSRLYGRKLSVNIYKKIRPLKRYASDKELISRIKKDISQSKKYFK